ncbi:hypothetical protein BUALT_Bualt17G0022000 [Buddleja alternifolia]|uniref:Uncharacterized protein n=1 Tax=Buddleja alternifolia TaxID=168488 RepID=A0AAV6W740_9LAMI|nr:hypothetical protein BUALT_Bualt17G0022000 [Buddleja alternifolia]
MKIMAYPKSVRDRLVALEARVQRTEALLGQLLETPMIAIFQKFQDLDERVKKLGKSVNEIPSFIEGRMVSLAEDLGILTDAVDMKLEAVNVEISVLKRATEKRCQVARVSDSKKVSMASMFLVGDAKLRWRSHVSDDVAANRGKIETWKFVDVDIRDMSEEDKLFNFMAGMQGWDQTELRRQGVKDLPLALATADSLVDFSGIEVRGSKIK